MNIKLTIDRFENNKAVLKTENNNEIIWPKDKLPEQAREGMILNFNIADNIQAEKEKKKLAKDILNEILDVKE